MPPPGPTTGTQQLRGLPAGKRLPEAARPPRRRCALQHAAPPAGLCERPLRHAWLSPDVCAHCSLSLSPSDGRVVAETDHREENPKTCATLSRRPPSRRLARITIRCGGAAQRAREGAVELILSPKRKPAREQALLGARSAYPAAWDASRIRIARVERRLRAWTQPDCAFVFPFSPFRASGNAGGGDSQGRACWPRGVGEHR